jgi:hypothetical protein
MYCHSKAHLQGSQSQHKSMQMAGFGVAPIEATLGCGIVGEQENFTILSSACLPLLPPLPCQPSF